MRIGGQILWLAITAVLTLLVLIVAFPLLAAKYGASKATLLSGVLIAGMVLYYLRGVWLSRLKKN